MRKNSLCFALILLVSNAFASEDILRQGLKALTTSAIEGPTISCDYSAYKLSPGYFNKGADCTDFVKSDGEFGPLGDSILNHIKELGEDTLFYDNNLTGAKQVCPNWHELSREEKSYFWVWLFAAISFKESTCGAHKVNADATHGTAVGHLQLNKRKGDRAWRGGDTGDSCAAQDIKPDVANLKCGVEILHEQLKGADGAYEGDGNLFGPKAHSYWAHLRRHDGGKIIKLLKTFPTCKK